MTVSQDLLLLALDPTSGKVRLPPMKSDPVLGGAVLMELVRLGRVTVEGEKRKARVVVADPAPVADPVLEEAFGRIRHKGRQAPRSAVARLGKKQRKAVLASMMQSETVRDRGERFLGIGLGRFEVLDVARRDDLLTRVRSVLLQDLPADDVTGPLVGLLLAGDLLRLVVERSDRKRAGRRAEVVADGDWAGKGVQQAISSAQAAMMGAIGAGAAVGSAGS